LERWDPEIYVFIPGNEIALISQLWPNPVHHFKLAANRVTNILLSMRHDIANKDTCLTDLSYMDFTKCFKSKVRESFLSSDNLRNCPECADSNSSICGFVQMKYFLEPGRELRICSTSDDAFCSIKCFSRKMR
jgi:hypothetical protein